MNGKVIRTTLTLPADLFTAMDRVIREGKARNRGELVTRAIRRELEAQKRADIDAEFLAMAADPVSQNESAIIEAEFLKSDAEAIRLGEGHE